MRGLSINGRFLTQSVTGVQRVGIEFCRALDSLLAQREMRNIEIEVIVPANGTIVTDVEFDHIKIRRFGRLRGHLWEQLELPIAARGRRLLAIGNTAPLISLLLNPSATSVMVHDLSYKYFPDAYTRRFRVLYELLVPIALKRAGAVFTVSDSEKDAILSTYPNLPRPERLIAVQNGTVESHVASTPDRSSRGRRCLYVGSLTKRKNAEGLIEAAITLAREHDATFTFIGSTGPRFEGVALEVPPDVSSRIQFLGQVDDGEALIQAYSRSAVFVFPSFYEASPLPPTEAMACGCPVVASAIPSLQERCGPAAEYCDPSSVDSIVESVVKVLDDDALWTHLSASGLAWNKGFSWSGQARQIIERVLRQQ